MVGVGHGRKNFCLSAFLLGAMMTFPVMAQVANTGSVQGTVLDQSGAAVPDASVTLTNSATTATLGVQTNSSGVFRFPIVPVGRYTLTVNKPGFKSYVQSEFPVEAASPITVNASLALGQTSQEVTVSGLPTTINTVTASEGNTVTYK
jgi:hypothetical protein